jgi:hypothetical protein
MYPVKYTFWGLWANNPIFWPEGERVAQLERFAAEVVPGVREAVAHERGRPTAAT